MAAVSPASLSPTTTPPPDKQQRRWPLEVLWVLAILAGGNLVGSASCFSVWRSRTPLACLGFVRPRNLARTVVLGTLVGIALKLALKAFIMPALGFDAINPVYRYVTGNPSALWRMLLFVTIGGGMARDDLPRIPVPPVPSLGTRPLGPAANHHRDVFRVCPPSLCRSRSVRCCASQHDRAHPRYAVKC